MTEETKLMKWSDARDGKPIGGDGLDTQMRDCKVKEMVIDGKLYWLKDDAFKAMMWAEWAADTRRLTPYSAYPTIAPPSTATI